MLAAFRVGALGNHCGRPQNGTASTGKLSYSNVRYRRPSNCLQFLPACRNPLFFWRTNWEPGTGNWLL